MYDLIFNYPFIQRAIFAGLILSIIGPIAGIYLVIKRYSNFTDSISHISLLGIVLGVLLNYNSLFLALIITVIFAIILEFWTSKSTFYNESILLIGVIFSASILNIILNKNRNLNLNNLFFGNILAISWNDVINIYIIGIVILLIFWWQKQNFFNLTFNPQFYKLNIKKPIISKTLLSLITSLITAISVSIIGSLLVSSIIILPILAVWILKLGFYDTLKISILINFSSIITGIIISYYLSLPISASISLILLSWIIIILFLKRFFMYLKIV